jgi:hypothetical protein
VLDGVHLKNRKLVDEIAPRATEQCVEGMLK